MANGRGERTGRKIEIFFFPTSAHTGEEEEQCCLKRHCFMLFFLFFLF
jgi:hypothetical protein